MTVSAEERIRERIEACVREVLAISQEAAVSALDQALGTIGEQATQAVELYQAQPSETASELIPVLAPKQPQSRLRRSREEVRVLMDRIEALVMEKPYGLSRGEIAELLDVSSRDVQRPMQLLMSKNRIRIEGERRAARYFPILTSD